MRPRTSYGFGIVRSLDSSAARAKLADVCDHLSRALGAIVFPQQSLSYRELAEGLERGTLGFAWLPPLLAIDLEDRKHVVPVALPVRRGTTSYHSALITRRGGPKTLDEIRGKRIAWVDRESAAGFVIPRMHLIGAGFDVRSLFGAESFVHSHEAVVEAVLSGRADLGATFCTLDPVTNRVLQAGWTARDGTAPKPVETIALAGPIPNDVIVAGTAVPVDIRARFLGALTSMDAKTRALFDGVLRAEAFRPASTTHFEPLRRMMLHAKDRADLPPSSRR